MKDIQLERQTYLGTLTTTIVYACVPRADKRYEVLVLACVGE